MSVGTSEGIKIVDITEKNVSAGSVEYTTGFRGKLRLSFQAIFAGYTAVTVKVQATLDDVTWSDVSNFSITATGNIVSGEIGPYSQIRVHVTATLSGGTDTLEVWMAMGTQPK